jgi:hypothetical protein
MPVVCLPKSSTTKKELRNLWEDPIYQKKYGLIKDKERFYHQ